jgi:protein-disulfide isomerase
MQRLACYVAVTAIFAAITSGPILAQAKAGKSITTDDDVARRLALNLDDAPLRGNKDAPLTIVEFTDFQCPICHGFFLSVFGDLKKNYIDTGIVRFYNRDLPLETIHPDAMRAAQACRCANEQRQFWPLHDWMSANPDQLDLSRIAAFALSLGLDSGFMRRCIASGKYKKSIMHDVREATKLGATGTPVFVIGRSTAHGVEGEVLQGARSYAELDRKLRTLLRPAQ